MRTPNVYNGKECYKRLKLKVHLIPAKKNFTKDSSLIGIVAADLKISMHL